MQRGVVLLLILVSLGASSCRTGVKEPEVPSTLVLKSPAFEAGKPIPEKYSAYGANVSPPLEWTGVPEGTVTYALVVEDPDAPSSTPFVHWVLYNIAASAQSIPEGMPPVGSVPGKNGMDTIGYFGPKPPSGVHHYHFKLFALSKVLTLAPGATRDELMKQISGSTLARGELVGTYAH